LIETLDKEIAPEPAWDDLLNELARDKGIALIIGETNSGKSTLARYLIKSLVSKGLTVSLVDCDIGQSSLGLPGTISMKVFRKGLDYSRFYFHTMSFIGTTNPVLIMPSMIKISKRMVDLAGRTSQITLVDTTGLVSGRFGKILKTGKIEEIKPDHIIAICKDRELDHILQSTGEANVHRLRRSANAKTRRIAARIRYREERLQSYFKRSPLFRFKLDDGSKRKFLYYARSLKSEGHIPRGTIIGLNRYNDTIALGILIGSSMGSITFETPLKSAKRINRVIFGDIALRNQAAVLQYVK
jgi:polynucleotide 5'-hydroxyl-kinase GRC3/NOL9